MSIKAKKSMEIVKNQGAQAALITSFHNKFYLTGFTGTTATVLVTESNQYVMVDFRYIDQAKNQCKNSVVLLVDDVSNTVAKCINDIVHKEKIITVGFEKDQMTVAEFEVFDSSINAQLVGIDFNELRIHKLPEEIEIMQKAADIADEAIGHIMEVIKPGMTESEVDLILYNKIRQLGAKSFSFNTIVEDGVEQCHMVWPVVK